MNAAQSNRLEIEGTIRWRVVNVTGSHRFVHPACSMLMHKLTLVLRTGVNLCVCRAPHL